MKSGIDISHHQGGINFCDLVTDFVIIKCGGFENGKFYIDSMYERNYIGCKAHNIKIGIYYYIDNSINEYNLLSIVSHILSLIKDKKFDLPFYIDCETSLKERKEEVTELLIEVAKQIESKKYYVGFYGSSVSVFKDRLNLNKLKDRFTLWVADYNGDVNYVPKKYVDMRQVTSNGKKTGINGYVDFNELYNENLITVIHNKKFNNN